MVHTIPECAKGREGTRIAVACCISWVFYKKFPNWSCKFLMGWRIRWRPCCVEL